jgi:hypothetical protein
MAPIKTTRIIVSSVSLRRDEGDQATRVIRVQRVISSEEHRESVARAFRAAREAHAPRE